MIEYVFFHRELAEEFTRRLRERGVASEVKSDALGFVIAVPDDLDGDLLDELDQLSDELLERSERLLETADDGSDKQAAAITITLRDGRTTEASVRPDLMNKILETLSFEELNELVEAIADSIENPDDRPFCRR